MPQKTTNYELNIYDTLDDINVLYLDYRDAISGTGAESNMQIIDGVLQELRDDLDDVMDIIDETGFSVILGNGITAPISSGLKGYIEVPANCELVSWRLISNVIGTSSGSIVVDVWKNTYANFPPTVTDTISGSATKPTLTNSQKNENTTLVGWTKTLTKGDWLGFNVDVCSGSSINQVTLSFVATITKNI